VAAVAAATRWIASCSAVLPLILFALFWSGDLSLMVAVTTPGLVSCMFLYASASYAGVRAYTSLIRRHGSATAVGLATLRKVATLVTSYGLIPTAATTAHAKHFGTGQVAPSVLILLGLLLSAWSERRKKSPPTTMAATAETKQSPAEPVMAISPSLARRHVDSFSSLSEATSPSHARRDAAADQTRALARDLGLETDQETDAETDVEDTGAGAKRVFHESSHGQACATF
jgi:hypothetical protein